MDTQILVPGPKQEQKMQTRVPRKSGRAYWQPMFVLKLMQIGWERYINSSRNAPLKVARLLRVDP